MKKFVWSTLVCIGIISVLLLNLIPTGINAVVEKQPYIVSATDSSETVLQAWNSGNYSYVKLTSGFSVVLNGETVMFDLAGNDLIATGNGRVQVFDSANDTFDHTVCGLVTFADTVTCDTEVYSPTGIRYVALKDGNRATMHRLEMSIKTVTLRTSSAGLYYKAVFQCDRRMEQAVSAYGVAVSLADMPGSDFKTASTDMYTVSGEKFISGATVTSGSVVGILKDGLSDKENNRRYQMQVYANAYMELNGQILMSDTSNAGKNVNSAGFTGNAASLQEVILALDNRYASLSNTVKAQLDNFCDTWKNEDAIWSFENIGSGLRKIDNSDLLFDTGTSNAYCPVCEKNVTWTALKNSTTMIAATDGCHYYLADDLTVSLSGSGVYAYLQAPGKTGHKACLHLNGHNLTSTKVPALHGSNGVLNVMGNGVVTGFQDSSTKSRGAAVQVNNYIATNAVNLYGGTYRKMEGSNSNAAVIGIRSNGGGVFAYEGVTIDADTGYAIYSAAPNRVHHRLGLYGCTVNGAVEFDASETEDYQHKVEIHDTVINGTVKLSENMSVVLSGKLNIDRIVIPEEMRLTTGGIDKSSNIGVDANGDFIRPIGNAADYLNVFKAFDSKKAILLRDNTLRCGVDYVSDLEFTTGTNALCPVCQKEVQWIALTGGDTPVTLTAGGHYYLADDVVYSGTDAAYITALAGTDKVFCVHLNGHNLTAENARAFYGSSSTLNIMGSGVVSGRKGTGYGDGSVVQSNTSNINGTINLYGGTYQQARGAGSNEFVINLNDAGYINLYHDVVVNASASKIAVRLGTANSGRGTVGIYGAKIHGDVMAVGANQDKNAITTLLLDDVTISGTLDVNGINTVSIMHGTKIGMLDAEDTTVLSVDRLIDGADITVKNAGVIAQYHEQAEKYLKYFSAAWIDDKIINRDGILLYKTNYTAKLLIDGEGKAWCPACMKYVVWTELKDTDALTVAQNGTHYYLASDIYHTGTTTSCFKAPETKYHMACLHLNGYNITAESVPAIYGSSGVLNVMGDGIVSGYGSSNRGTAVQLNNYLTSANAVNLYSGTYTKGSNAASGAYVVGFAGNGGGLYVYEDAVIDGNNAIYVGVPHASGDNILYLEACAVKGNITVVAPDSARTTKTVFNTVNATVNGSLNIYGSHDVTFSGRTVITKLNLAAGTVVKFENMLPGSDITVSANGIFTTAMEQADDWLQYLQIDEVGDVLIVRDNCFYQGAQLEVPQANAVDVEQLLALYDGAEVRYGEMHDHTNTGPNADGFYTVEQWRQKMLEIGMDFTTIVDHRQSVHMYDPNWDSSMFIGGSEPSTRIIDHVVIENNNFHYNMIFADAADLETVFKSFSGYKYKEAADGNGGTVVTYWLKRQEFLDTAALVRELGGFFVAVHPKYAGYLVSNDPLDYYYGEYTGIEITTGTGGNMAYEENEKAYQLWLDLLDLGKKVYATAGSDFHKLPNASALTTLYGSDRDAQAYVDIFRSGNFAPGWVGIRMAIGDTAMGGTTDFSGKRLVFSVGDMYDVAINDGYSGSYCYQEDHIYSVQLYDDGGLLMESQIDPSQMNYFAIDADEESKFYRVVVWDLTENTRVGVGNPIWNN